MPRRVSRRDAGRLAVLRAARLDGLPGRSSFGLGEAARITGRQEKPCLFHRRYA
jgi:hypothetical protein